MIGLEDVRRYAMAFPEVTEATHFRLPAFKVQDTTFFVLQRGGTHAIVSVDEQEAVSAATEDPAAYEVVRRNGGRIFVGVRVDLARASKGRLRELVQLAWRNKAPKRLGDP